MQISLSAVVQELLKLHNNTVIYDKCQTTPTSEVVLGLADCCKCLYIRSIWRNACKQIKNELN